MYHLSLDACCLLSVTLSHALVSSLAGTYLPVNFGHTHVLFYPLAQPNHLRKQFPLVF